MDKIPVFFTDTMVAESKSASPSSSKPPKVVAAWEQKFSGKIRIVEPDPVTLDQIKAVHDPQFVDDILSSKKDNGFGNSCPIIAKTLPFTSGAMLSAAKEALRNQKVAVAPVSGFHHASTEKAEGFCTFNGLVITAKALHDTALAKRVGILDLDCHYGNGTDEIINRQKINWIQHFTGGRWFTSPSQVELFFNTLPNILTDFLGCDVVLYQAGADPHINDPYGGWMSTEAMILRDKMVFEFLSKYRIPVAWNLAGGYQVEKDGSIPNVLKIHNNTMRECINYYLT